MLETGLNDKVAALVADAFQDSEFFLPKIALQDQVGVDVEVVSSKRAPIEIYSYFSRIGVLDVDSPKLARFDQEDRAGLEALVKRLLSATA